MIKKSNPRIKNLYQRKILSSVMMFFTIFLYYPSSVKANLASKEGFFSIYHETEGLLSRGKFKEAKALVNNAQRQPSTTLTGSDHQILMNLIYSSAMELHHFGEYLKSNVYSQTRTKKLFHRTRSHGIKTIRENDKVLVTSVLHGSHAQTLGIKKGDILSDLSLFNQQGVFTPNITHLRARSDGTTRLHSVNHDTEILTLDYRKLIKQRIFFSYSVGLKTLYSIDNRQELWEESEALLDFTSRWPEFFKPSELTIILLMLVDFSNYQHAFFGSEELLRFNLKLEEVFLRSFPRQGPKQIDWSQTHKHLLSKIQSSILENKSGRENLGDAKKFISLNKATLVNNFNVVTDTLAWYITARTVSGILIQHGLLDGEEKQNLLSLQKLITSNAVNLYGAKSIETIRAKLQLQRLTRKYLGWDQSSFYKNSDFIEKFQKEKRSRFYNAITEAEYNMHTCRILFYREDNVWGFPYCLRAMHFTLFESGFLAKSLDWAFFIRVFDRYAPKYTGVLIEIASHAKTEKYGPHSPAKYHWESIRAQRLIDSNISTAARLQLLAKYYEASPPLGKVKMEYDKFKLKYLADEGDFDSLALMGKKILKEYGPHDFLDLLPLVKIYLLGLSKSDIMIHKEQTLNELYDLGAKIWQKKMPKNKTAIAILKAYMLQLDVLNEVFSGRNVTSHEELAEAFLKSTISAKEFWLSERKEDYKYIRRAASHYKIAAGKMSRNPQAYHPNQRKLVWDNLFHTIQGTFPTKIDQAIDTQILQRKYPKYNIKNYLQQKAVVSADVENYLKSIFSVNKALTSKPRKRRSIIQKSYITLTKSHEALRLQTEKIFGSLFPRNLVPKQPPLELETIQRRLKEGEALFIFDNKRDDETCLITFCLYSIALIKRDAVEYIPLMSDESFIIKDLRSSVLDPSYSHNMDHYGIEEMKNWNVKKNTGFDFRNAYYLYQQFFKPAKKFLQDVDHLYVLDKGGALGKLPITLLITSPPDGNTDVSNAEWLINQFAITLTPSIRAFYKLNRDWEISFGRKMKFLGVGDPNFKNGSIGTSKLLETAEGSRSFVLKEDQDSSGLNHNFQSLPETKQELLSINSFLDGKVENILLSGRATEANIKAMDLKTFDIIAFATHGVVGGEIPGLDEPALVLTMPKSTSILDDGYLKASEILKLNINAELVVLSACNTASGENANAEGLSGLAKAFFYAGAKSLLVSHWPVDSGATVKLVTGFFKNLSKDNGMTKAEALRRSILTLIKDKKYNHPRYWSPFVLVGDGSRLDY